jgi:hypothetical protein
MGHCGNEINKAWFNFISFKPTHRAANLLANFTTNIITLFVAQKYTFWKSIFNPHNTTHINPLVLYGKRISADRTIYRLFPELRLFQV